MKHQRKFKDKQDRGVEQTEYFYGDKAHVSMNAASELITGLEVSAGGAYDGHHFTGLLGKPNSGMGWDAAVMWEKWVLRCKPF